MTRNPEAEPPEDTEPPSTSLIVESTSTARMVLAPDVRETSIDTMSVIADPKSVATYFVKPDRLPPRIRRVRLSSTRTFTAQGEG